METGGFKSSYVSCLSSTEISCLFGDNMSLKLFVSPLVSYLISLSVSFYYLLLSYSVLPFSFQNTEKRLANTINSTNIAIAASSPGLSLLPLCYLLALLSGFGILTEAYNAKKSASPNSVSSSIII